MKYFFVTLFCCLFYYNNWCIAVQPRPRQPVFELAIRDGDCQYEKGNVVTIKDLVEEEAHPTNPVTKTLEIHGKSQNCKHINCIIAVHNYTFTEQGARMPDPLTQRIAISKGGIGYNHAFFRMQSDPSFPLRYEFILVCDPINDKISSPVTDDPST